MRRLYPNPKKDEEPTVVSKLLEKCRDVVTYFRHSHLQWEYYQRLQKQHLDATVQDHNLIQAY